MMKIQIQLKGTICLDISKPTEVMKPGLHTVDEDFMKLWGYPLMKEGKVVILKEGDKNIANSEQKTLSYNSVGKGVFFKDQNTAVVVDSDPSEIAKVVELPIVDNGPEAIITGDQQAATGNPGDPEVNPKAKLKKNKLARNK